MKHSYFKEHKAHLIINANLIPNLEDTGKFNHLMLNKNINIFCKSQGKFQNKLTSGDKQGIEQMEMTCTTEMYMINFGLWEEAENKK